MIGAGTIINTAAIIAGGVVGGFGSHFFKQEQQDSLGKVCGVSVLFIAVAGAMEGMLSIDGGVITSGKSLFLVVCLALGTVIGEIIGIERLVEIFGEWLKRKTKNTGDEGFVSAFVSASLTVSIGAMAIVGSIQDGVSQDFTTLTVKAILDFIIIVVMTSAMGKGAAFSAIPVFILEGAMTLLATLIAPVLTDLALDYISLVGSTMIFCVGINLVWGNRIRVANMLPAIILAAVAAYLPIEF